MCCSVAMRAWRKAVKGEQSVSFAANSGLSRQKVQGVKVLSRVNEAAK